MTWTWEQLKHDIDAFGKACMAAGAAQRSSVNIIGFNSPEWGIAYHGAICCDMIATGVYTTSNSEACRYVAEHSEAEVIVVESLHTLEKYQSILPHLT